MRVSSSSSVKDWGRVVVQLTVRAHDLPLGNLLHEVHLPLRGVLGEALVDGRRDGLPDLLPLVLRVRLGLLLLVSRTVALVAAELAAEFGMGAALPVEVDRICCLRGRQARIRDDAESRDVVRDCIQGKGIRWGETNLGTR